MLTEVPTLQTRDKVTSQGHTATYVCFEIFILISFVYMCVQVNGHACRFLQVEIECQLGLQHNHVTLSFRHTTFPAGWHSQETLGELTIAKHRDMVSLLMKCHSSTEFWRHTCFLQECGLSLGSHDTRQTVSDSHRLGIPAASSTACPFLSRYSPPPPVEMFSFCHGLHLELSSPHPRIWDTEDLKIAGLRTDPHTSISGLSHQLGVSLQSGPMPTEAELPQYCLKPGEETTESVL